VAQSRDSFVFLASHTTSFVSRSVFLSLSFSVREKSKEGTAEEWWGFTFSYFYFILFYLFFFWEEATEELALRKRQAIIVFSFFSLFKGGDGRRAGAAEATGVLDTNSLDLRQLYKNKVSALVYTLPYKVTI
jgi:hypothetical protein